MKGHGPLKGSGSHRRAPPLHHPRTPPPYTSVQLIKQSVGSRTHGGFTSSLGPRVSACTLTLWWHTEIRVIIINVPQPVTVFGNGFEMILCRHYGPSLIEMWAINAPIASFNFSLTTLSAHFAINLRGQAGAVHCVWADVPTIRTKQNQVQRNRSRCQCHGLCCLCFCMACFLVLQNVYFLIMK